MLAIGVGFLISSAISIAGDGVFWELGHVRLALAFGVAGIGVGLIIAVGESTR